MSPGSNCHCEEKTKAADCEAICRLCLRRSHPLLNKIALLYFELFTFRFILRVMTKESLVFICGLLVLITAKLGIPSDWKEYIYLACGLLLLFVGYSLRRAAYLRSIENEKGEYMTESFVESVPVEQAISEHQTQMEL